LIFSYLNKKKKLRLPFPLFNWDICLCFLELDMHKKKCIREVHFGDPSHCSRILFVGFWFFVVVVLK